MIKRFNRYELKYIVTVEQAEALAEEIRATMVPDSAADPSGVYPVTSLYYDTRGLDFYRAKLDGVRYRRKLRIRRYGPLGRGPLTPVTVEIKQRINRTTQKRRIAMDLEGALELCAGQSERRWAAPDDAAVASEIEFLVRGLALTPACTVSYVRQAFIGSIYEPGLRVTFDRSIWCRHPVYGFQDDGARYAFVPPTRIILEVKANDAVPLWMSRLLARHDCTVARFSKYCSGVAQLRGLLPAHRLRSEEGSDG